MPQSNKSLTLPDADATEAAGAALARAVAAESARRFCIWLHGELGAGKTTFARGFLRGLGHSGRVPSPTYTLVEPYEYAGLQVFHLDLYRLSDGAELEFLGISEMQEPGQVLLVEWPEKGGDRIPAADLAVVLAAGPEGRTLSAAGGTEEGAGLREAWFAAIA